ncbi:MAG: ATP synthase F1 subunit gamma [Phycisphaerae bacterium]|nr:ATP synthase F1 subunit gamma [Phycisphaerae bacterium]
MSGCLEPLGQRSIADREPGEVLEHPKRLEGPVAVGIDDAKGRGHGFLQRRPGFRVRRRPASDATISTPMAQIREIKKRMVAVRTIQRITKTMQMIATAKFTASLARAKATRPYTDRIRKLVGEVAAAAGDVAHPLLQGGGSSGKVLVLVIGSDRGLCGAYNGNVLRTAMVRIKALKAQGKQVVVHTAGKKAFAFFKYQQMMPEERFTFGDRPKYDDIQALADRYMDAFISGGFEQVVVCSMRFVSNARQVAEAVQLLPLSMPQAAQGAPTATYEFSPGASEILDDLLPRSVKVSLFQAFNDAVVSENVMRMVAMKAATDNASGLGRTLKRNYNRARQARITTELTEIVSGAAALG